MTLTLNNNEPFNTFASIMYVKAKWFIFIFCTTYIYRYFNKRNLNWDTHVLRNCYGRTIMVYKYTNTVYQSV